MRGLTHCPAGFRVSRIPIATSCLRAVVGRIVVVSAVLYGGRTGRRLHLRSKPPSHESQALAGGTGARNSFPNTCDVSPFRFFTKRWMPNRGSPSDRPRSRVGPAFEHHGFYPGSRRKIPPASAQAARQSCPRAFCLWTSYHPTPRALLALYHGVVRWVLFSVHQTSSTEPSS
jgi:hypothetical protein